VWEGQVADLVKADRLNRLNAVVNRVAEERAQRFAGRQVEVLVEGPNPRDDSQVGSGGREAGATGAAGIMKNPGQVWACGLRPALGSS
jgi:tRNA A37 methylthiotransferase MiaB